MSKENKNTPVRLSVTIRGAVQGVGFRPFVYRLATDMSLVGWISNSAQGVFIEVEGEKNVLDRFLLRLQKEIPPRAHIQSLEFSFLDPIGFEKFEIRESESTGTKTTLVLPDIATCPDCLKEIFDPSDRRYLYPFTNCTNCGPRFSIIESLPYDRQNTSMKKFEMCPACRTEYDNPADRRFHAQPNACPVCGPKLELWDDGGVVLTEEHEALLKTAESIRTGKIAAVKGIGGFHLMADARNDEAVSRLRERKHREEKPFALMFPSLESIKQVCEVDDLEERLLLSPESPIVLLSRIQNTEDRIQETDSSSNLPSTIFHLQSFLSSSVAPNNPYLGIMLPYTPLHHILMKELGFPVVATSGNLSDEPICTDETETLERLKGVADVFLVHNRPIVRHVDDSIVRVMLGRELVLRRARGYAPLPVQIRLNSGSPLLAVGAHLKNTIALSVGDNVFISQHIGDLETKESLSAFRAVIQDFQNLYESKPEHIVCDLHPDYLSTKYARILESNVLQIQHHYAHIASCMAENQIEGEVLGVSWDGTGYGIDGTIWGGEFLLTTGISFERVATLRPFRLPGGDKAIKGPKRTAMGLLYEILGNDAFKKSGIPTLKAFQRPELDMIQQMLIKKINSPVTTSVGRLFDGVASLLGLRQIVNFEGQAAMELEFLTSKSKSDEAYTFAIDDLQLSNGKEPAKSAISNLKSRIFIDWRPLISSILDDIDHKVAPSIISTKFHNTLTEVIIAVAKKIGQPRVVLSGGCFQNRYLTERTVIRLQQEGFHPYWHQRVPPNDGGISLGQIAAALRSFQSRKS